MRALTGGLTVVCGVFLAAIGMAQEAPAPAYGVGNQSVYVSDVWNMSPEFSTETWSVTAGRNRYMTTAGLFQGGVQVPRGAWILRIELEGCDTSPTGHIFGEILRAGDGSATPLTVADTSDAFTGGCLRIAHDLPAPETVDGSRYIVYAGNTSFDGATNLGAVRVFYDLQVSPAPAA